MNIRYNFLRIEEMIKVRTLRPRRIL